VSYRAPEPSHWEGHQEDHTVAYVVGPMPATPPGLPAGVPDPATVISAAIGPAATAWNTAAAAIVGKNLKICESGSRGCDNHDGGIIMVKTEDTNTKDTRPPNHDPDEGCGLSVACVKLGVPSSSASSSDGPGNHLRDLWLVIEEPAWQCWDPNAVVGNMCPQHFRIYWTDNVGQARMSGPHANSAYVHIGAAMIHEFGHTFGILDFGNDPTLKNVPAVMENPHKNRTITDEDIEQLRAIYALHESINHN